MKLYIAIDDTDNLESIGTGRLSRMLAEELTDRGWLRGCRITRHQLLVHPEIPYTSHNSSACIDAEAVDCSVADVADFARSFLRRHFHKGANPGLCIVPQDCVPVALPPFGLRAKCEVIPLAEAKILAESLDAYTWWHGETGQGCIGAMSAVGLRSSGNDGRYIGLEGIRETGGRLTVGELLRLTAIDRVSTLDGETLANGELVETQNWVRPVLKEGLITLEVIPLDGYWRAPHEKKAKKKKS
ncbi:MAG: hypothetical protein JW902_07855 [Syntrophaceae bacterium]|nr:hypothetical protein [Syntrophaceae bacterium]